MPSGMAASARTVSTWQGALRSRRSAVLPMTSRSESPELYGEPRSSVLNQPVRRLSRPRVPATARQPRDLRSSAGSSACAGQGRLLFLTALTGRFERRVRGRGSSRPSAGASPAARYSSRRSWLPSTNVRPPEATARRAAGTALHPSAAAEPAARRTANRTPCSARTAPRRHPRFLGRGGAICSKSILIRLERMVREHRRAGHTSRIEQDSVGSLWQRWPEGYRRYRSKVVTDGGWTQQRAGLRFRHPFRQAGRQRPPESCFAPVLFRPPVIPSIRHMAGQVPRPTSHQGIPAPSCQQPQQLDPVQGVRHVSHSGH